MKIAVNTRLLISNKLDGIGWFSLETLKRICQSNPEVTFYFLFDRPFSEEFIFSKNIVPVVLGPPTRHPVLWYFWFEWRLPKALKCIKPDLFFSPDGYLSLRSNVKSLAVIHDLNFAHYPKDLPFTSRFYYNFFFKRFAKKANRLLTVSNFSKTDIEKSYAITPSKIDVAYNGYNPIYQPISDSEKKEAQNQYASGYEYFVFIGSLHPRKNVANMLRAFELFRKKSEKKVKFLIIGQKFFKTGDIAKTLSAMSLSKDVHFLGHMNPDEIRKILGAAISLVFVSKFEGFGIPVLEALKCDTPVIVSDVTSLPEVAGKAGLYANPFKVESICQAMQQMAENEDLRNKLIENGRKVCQNFSWDITAGKVWESMLKTIHS